MADTGFARRNANLLLPSATELRRLCFYRCVSVHKGVCLVPGGSAPGGMPDPGGGVCSQGGVYSCGGGCLVPGGLLPGDAWSWRGCLLRGGVCSPEGCLVPGSVCFRGVPGPGGLVFQHALRQTPIHPQIIWHNFCQKLHENGNTLTEGVGGVSHANPRSATVRHM